EHTLPNTDPVHPTAEGADEATHHTDRDLVPDDATHQALVNAWPRRFLGTLLHSEQDAFEYLARGVRSRGLPFDRHRVNVVGVRGMLGGELTHVVGAGRVNSRFDDSFFVLALDRSGNPRVSESRGTTEPGGRRRSDDGTLRDPNAVDTRMQV